MRSQGKALRSTRRRKWVLLVALSTAVLVAGCKASGKSNEAGIASAGDIVVLQSDLDLFLKGLPPDAKARYETTQGRKTAIQGLADRALLAEEARRRGLDQDPELRKRIESFLADRVLEAQTRERFTDEKAKELYEANKQKFTTQRYHIRHILIRVKADEGAEAESKARKRAQDVLGKLRKGGKFEELARKASEDEISGPKGGDLGLVSLGALPEPVAKAIPALKAGEISQVIQSPLGFHLVQLEGEPQTEVRSFEQTRPLLEMMFREEVQEDLLKDLRGRFPLTLVETPKKGG